MRTPHPPPTNSPPPHYLPQVQHFDEQQETAARRVRFLNRQIADQASTAAGSLTGKAA